MCLPDDSSHAGSRPPGPGSTSEWTGSCARRAALAYLDEQGNVIGAQVDVDGVMCWAGPSLGQAKAIGRRTLRRIARGIGDESAYRPVQFRPRRDTVRPAARTTVVVVSAIVPAAIPQVTQSGTRVWHVWYCHYMRTSIYLPDDLAAAVKQHGISISEVAQRALREEVQVMQSATEDTEKIVVETKFGLRGFVGRWTLDPDTEDRLEIHDAGGGALYGVAITAKGQYVVYAAPIDADWGREFKVYESLQAARDDGIPPSVIDVCRTSDAAR